MLILDKVDVKAKKKLARNRTFIIIKTSITDNLKLCVHLVTSVQLYIAKIDMSEKLTH